MKKFRFFNRVKKGSLKLVLYKYRKIFSSNDILIEILIETIKYLIETLNEALKIPNLKISMKLFKYKY